MTFLDDVAEESRARREQCKTCQRLAEMPDDLRAEVNAALDGPAAAAPIARAMSKRGFQVGQASVRAHRGAGHVVR